MIRHLDACRCLVEVVEFMDGSMGLNVIPPPPIMQAVILVIHPTAAQLQSCSARLEDKESY